MGLGHLFGLGGDTDTWWCQACGCTFSIEADEGPDTGALACPACGSEDLARRMIL